MQTRHARENDLIKLWPRTEKRKNKRSYYLRKKIGSKDNRLIDFIERECIGGVKISFILRDLVVDKSFVPAVNLLFYKKNIPFIIPTAKKERKLCQIKTARTGGDNRKSDKLKRVAW